MLTKLKTIYHRQAMHPGALALFVNPFYFARRELLGAVTQLGPSLGGRLLDVGCGDRPYEDLTCAREYVGLELDTAARRARNRADVYYDGTRFPFDDATFDSVLCNQVLEHVFEPDAFLSEIARVLRPRGRLLLTVPFVWDEHEQPRDFARYSSYGVEALLSRHGLHVVQQRKTAPDARAVFQLINAYLYKSTVTRNAYVNMVVTLLLMAPFNLLGVVASRLLPANPDLFLDNVVLAEKSTSA